MIFFMAWLVKVTLSASLAFYVSTSIPECVHRCDNRNLCRDTCAVFGNVAGQRGDWRRKFASKGTNHLIFVAFLLHLLCWYYIQRLENFDGTWRLTDVGPDEADSKAPRLLYELVRSTSFQIAMMVVVLLNAVINASFVYHHNKTDLQKKRVYYILEVTSPVASRERSAQAVCLQIAFTVLFNLECALKIAGLSWSGYIRRGQHKFELVLCVGSSLNVFPSLYGSHVFTYFQVFRILRLIKASPMLEDFVYKVKRRVASCPEQPVADLRTGKEARRSCDIHHDSATDHLGGLTAVILQRREAGQVPHVPACVHDHVPNHYARRLDRRSRRDPAQHQRVDGALCRDLLRRISSVCNSGTGVVRLLVLAIALDRAKLVRRSHPGQLGNGRRAQEDQAAQSPRRGEMHSNQIHTYTCATYIYC